MQTQASRKKDGVFYILLIRGFAYCKIKVQIPFGKRDYINSSICMTKCGCAFHQAGLSVGVNNF
jgi:hypothetical protein